MMQEEEVPKPKRKLSNLPSVSSTQSSENLHGRPSILRSISYVEEAVPYTNRFWKCTLPVKVVQLVTSVMCAVLYFKGQEMMKEGPRRSMPHVIYYSFVVVNAIKIVDYLVVRRLPGHVIRILGFLGGILYTVAGTLCLETWAKEMGDNHGHLKDIQDMLLAGGLASFFNAIMYFVDTVINCKIWIRGMCMG